MTALFVAWFACDLGPSFSQVQKIDTIEAYEDFEKHDPQDYYKPACEKRLEELYYAKAAKEATRASWQAYLDRFPDGPNKAHAQREVAFAAYAEAVKEGTAEAFRGFVKAYPKSDRWLVARAEGRAAVLEYGKLTLADPILKEVNMAEDPKGELNGWSIKVDVANGGDQKLGYVGMTIDFLADDGHVLATKDYPLVSPTWNMPATTEQTTPIKPGEKRTWEWDEAKQIDDPIKEAWKSDWHQKVRVNATGLRPAKDPAK